jgi:hypothetical protein
MSLIDAGASGLGTGNSECHGAGLAGKILHVPCSSQQRVLCLWKRLKMTCFGGRDGVGMEKTSWGSYSCSCDHSFYKTRKTLMDA